jgi:hypothetical protein
MADLVFLPIPELTNNLPTGIQVLVNVTATLLISVSGRYVMVPQNLAVAQAALAYDKASHQLAI